MVVYIAGPFRARTIIGVIVHIFQAALVAAKYWRLGYIVLCPHLNGCLLYKLKGLHDDNIWLQGDLELLRRCDAIVLMKTWRRSVGTRAERRFAIEHNIQVLYD